MGSPFLFINNYHGMGPGWKVDGLPGVFNTYGGAIAANMDLWEEMCEWHRLYGKHLTWKDVYAAERKRKRSRT